MARIKDRRANVVFYDHSLHKLHMVEVMVSSKYNGETSLYRVNEQEALGAALTRRPGYKDDFVYSFMGVLIGNQDATDRTGQITWAELVTVQEAVEL